MMMQGGQPLNANQQLQQAQMLMQHGRSQEALGILDGLYRLSPNNLQVVHLLAVVKVQLEDHAGAEPLLRRAIKLKPDFWAAYNNLGIVLRNAGKLKQARACYLNLVKSNPVYLDAYSNLCAILLELGSHQQALEVIDKGLSQAPAHAEMLYSKGTILTQLNREEEACEFFRQVLSLDAKHSLAANNLGCALLRLEQHAEAIDAFSRVLSLHPKHAEALYNRGKALIKVNRLVEAQKDFSEATALSPDNPEFSYSRAQSEQMIGDLEAAIDQYKTTLRLAPDNLNALSDLLLTEQYETDIATQDLLRRQSALVKQFVSATLEKQSARQRHTGPIRVGFVSPDFRNHSVAYFFEPLIKHLDSQKFAVFCYYNNVLEDEVTRRLQAAANKWRSVYDLDDGAFRALVLKDQIDILVDLSGHTAGSRVFAFAERMAPIQVSWLGYPAETCVPNIDFRLVDDITDPPGINHVSKVEALHRLPHSFLCYSGMDDVDYQQSPPCLVSKKVTFGSFNNFLKINDDVLEAWSRILNALPSSKLLIKNRQLGDPVLTSRVKSFFESRGVKEDRIMLFGSLAGTQNHLLLYNEIDIALDTFPYNGTTTTMEALWMGVPVVAYKGDRHASRVSASLLCHAGLEELVAEDMDGYVDLAVGLANDPERLKVLRKNAREKLKQSPVCDGPRFARDMEQAFESLLSKKG